MPHHSPTPAETLGKALCDALRQLGDAGQPEAANELAAHTWSAVRHDLPAVARRLNGAMHHLASLSPTSPDNPTTQEEHPMNDDELDVRDQPPARRHDLILTTYQDLSHGDGFVLVNDHDPKPLYYQFAAEYPEQFTWEYLDRGPDVWRVRIGRPNE